MFPDRDGWRVQWTEHGKRRSKKFDSKKAAERFEYELKLGIADRSASTRHSPTFEAFSERWLKDYCEVEKAETQWAHDRSTIKQHLLPGLGSIRLANLQAGHLLALRSHIKDKTSQGKAKKPLSTRTVNNAVGLAKNMMGHAVDLGLIGANPFRQVTPLKEVKTRFDFWTGKERDEFLASAQDMDPDFCELVAVACHTGLRLGELAGLLRGDLDFDRSKIYVGKSFNMKLMKVIPTKNKRWAEVSMNSAVKAATSRTRAHANHVRVFDLALFHNARRRFGRLCKAVGSRPIRFHDLRHTFASCLAMEGMDLMRIQELMRHESYQMTLRYAHLHPGHLAGATEILCRTQTARSEFEGGRSGAGSSEILEP